jgi:outer membrane autotransporter protein
MRRRGGTAWTGLGCAALVAAGMFGSGAAAADLEITSNSGAVDLDAQAGSNVHVAPGVTVDGAGSRAFNATLAPWLLSNDGTLAGANTVSFTKGGTVENGLGAIITSTSSAIILGNTSTGGVGTVTNSGSISGGTFGDTVALYGGGTVTNLAGASISVANGGNTVSISGGTSRSVVNAGTISNTGGSFATGVQLQGTGATNTITNLATGTIHGGYNGIYASATAVITIDNAGTITSDRSAAIEATAGGTITNSGTITNTGVGGSAANYNAVLVRNTAAAEVINSGTITGAVNAINFTASGGGSTGAAHTVRLRTGSALNGNVLGGTGTDTLILEGTGSEGIGKFSNFETLSMQGSAWTLTGNGAFWVNSEVRSGVLTVAGQLTSPTVAVLPGGTLAGTGTVTGAVNNAGAVDVGTGTLTIDGPYVHAAGATLRVGATPSIAGLLSVAGIGHTATIEGGTVAVAAASGSYAADTTYTILTASGGRTGTFDGVTTTLAFLTPTLAYDANTVYLTLTRNSLDYAAIAETRNQFAAGAGIESLGYGAPLYNAVLLMDAADARATFDRVSGEIHASAATALIEDSRMVREAVNDRLRAAFARPGASAPAGAAAGEGVLLWGRAVAASGHSGGDGNAARLGRSGAGLLVGLDAPVLDAGRLGLAAGYSHASFDAAERASSGAADSYHLGLYGGGAWGPLALRAGLARSWHTIDSERSVVVPGFSDAPAGSSDAATTQLFAELGHAFDLGGGLGLEPFAGLAHVRYHHDGVRETGGAAALTGAGGGTAVTFTTLGVHGAAEVPLAGAALTLKGTLGWRHAFGDTVPEATVALAGAAPFTVAGVPIARDAAVTALAAELTAGAATLSLGYAGQYGGGARDQSVRATVSLRF